MTTFQRSDGIHLTVVDGFRDRILTYRESVTPKDTWGADKYRAAAKKKRGRFERLRAQVSRWLPSLEHRSVLDVGCGDGTNTLLFACEPVRRAVGIDLELPLFAAGVKGEQTRALAKELLRGLPIPARCRFGRMDATRMALADAAFDLIVSRSAMEHIRPVEAVLAEIARVARPDALIHLGIDPFCWVRGCHKRGVTDIPFAHARLSSADYRRFVAQREGDAAAARRLHRIETLNQFTVAQWRERISDMPCDVLLWQETPSEIGRAVLAEYPEIPETLQPGIGIGDLLCERIDVWLRRR